MQTMTVNDIEYEHQVLIGRSLGQQYMIEFCPAASLTQQCDCDNPSNVCVNRGVQV